MSSGTAVAIGGLGVKTLFILRHAKSSWDEVSLPDFDRPLNGRGRRAAPVMGKYLKKQYGTPELIQCSTAARAEETLQRLLPALGGKPVLTQEPRLYLAKKHTVLSVLNRVKGDPQSVLMIGHSPGIERFAADLIGEGDEKTRRLLASKYPTAALTVVTLDVDKWKQAAFGGGRLIDFIRPRDIDPDL